MLLKKWNDRLKKITPLRNNKLKQMFFMVVESTVLIDPAHPKEILEHM